MNLVEDGRITPDGIAMIAVVALILVFVILIWLWRRARNDATLFLRHASEVQRSGAQRELALLQQLNECRGRVEILTESNRTLSLSSQGIRTKLESLESEKTSLATRHRYIASAEKRISHDVLGRLSAIRKELLPTVSDKHLSTRLERELGTVMEKVRLHLADNIADHVRATIAKTAYSADGMLLREIIEGLVQLYKYENIYVEAPDVKIHGNWIHWDLMISHILTNAVVRASPTNGMVRVIVSVESGKTRIDIDNENSELAAADIPKVFDLGFTTKESGQGGIGLYVAQQIALGLSGEILMPTNRIVKKGLLKRIKVVRFTVINLPLANTRA